MTLSKRKNIGSLNCWL